MTTEAFDYPSQRSGLQFPAEPMLLDTCLVQHLKRVMDTIYDRGEHMSDEVEERLLRHYPAPLGPELVALGDLVTVLERNGPPWVVSESFLIEFEQLHSEKGSQLRGWWQEWADDFDGCLDGGWYPLSIEPARWPLSAECVPAFGPFPNAGDRGLIRDALRAGIPTILTTDRNSFWRHRRALYPLGVEIWRPTDLWKTLQRQAA